MPPSIRICRDQFATLPIYARPKAEHLQRASVNNGLLAGQIFVSFCVLAGAYLAAYKLRFMEPEPYTPTVRRVAFFVALAIVILTNVAVIAARAS